MVVLFNYNWGGTMKTFLGTFLFCVGMIAVMGSGGDCDGTCGPGHDVVTMLMISGAGLMSMILGIILLMKRITE